MGFEFHNNIKINIDEEITLTDLIDVSILQRMQDAFAKMARMAALTTDSEGVAVTQGTNFSELCTEFCRKSPIGKARCEQCDKMGAVMSLERKRPVSYRCHANLVDFAAPIMLGDRMIGSFIGGQVLPEAIDEDEMRRVASEIEVDETAFIEAAKKTQVIPQAAIERSTVFLYEFAQTMSEMAYHTYMAKQLSEEAMQAAVQKQDFLANMSHEIRTPMNAVLGMAEMALREPMSDKAKEYVNQIQTAGKHLLVIINDILDFSKIDSGKMTVVNTIYEVEALIDELTNVVNNRIGDKDIDFFIDAPCDMPVELYGDEVRIHQILLNLLNNAVKFTTSGFVKLSLEFEPIDDERVLFKAAVTDTGSGIKKEDLHKLFNSFQQVDSKRNRNLEGTGLGLAISKQLVELMGGSVSVESEYGKGSTFSFEIPQKVQTKGQAVKQLETPIDIYVYIEKPDAFEQIKKDLEWVNCNIINLNESDASEFAPGSVIIMKHSMDETEVLNMAERFPDVTIILIVPYDSTVEIKAKNVKILKRPGYSKKLLALMGLADLYTRENISDEDLFTFVAPEAKVLIVDDNPINLSIAKGLLEPLDMQIDTATGAKECLPLIQNNNYNLIFMDHMMPGVDGIETTHIIRRMYTDYEAVPIIALTANATADAQAMFLAEGMNDFVAKPIETEKIVAKVKKWLPEHMVVPAKVSAKKTDAMVEAESIVRRIDIPGLHVVEALELLKNEKLYLDFLREFYLTIDEKTKKILSAYDMGDIKTYTIEVHALKSSSRQIGAKALANDAEKLEKAGNANDLVTIKAGTSKLLGDFYKLKVQLADIFVEKAKSDKKELDINSIEAFVQKISEAIENFDFVLIDEVFDEIANYKTRNAKERDLIDKIKEAGSEFDQNRVDLLADEWKLMYC